MKLLSAVSRWYQYQFNYVLLIVDPGWNLTVDDYFDYMTSAVRLSNGYIDRVLDTLDGLDPRKNWISDDVDKKSNSYDLLYDGT